MQPTPVAQALADAPADAQASAKRDMAARAKRLLAAHPGHVPVIVENKCEGHELTSCKFLATREMNVSHFMAIVRKRMRPAPAASVALYLFSGASERIPAGAQTVGELYDRDKNEDQLLMVRLCKENTFG